jgi:Holliday junction resolvasome RuvABC endonuclease subunit
MKLDIKKIENKIGYKIKRNFKSIGLDTAQACGVVILKTNKTQIDVDYLVLSFKTKNHKEIYHSMVKTFERLIDDDMYAIIEQVFVGFSRAGSIELARYGSFCISECIKKGIDYDLISAVSARSKFNIDTKRCGKGKTKQAIGLWITETLGLNFQDDNINDAMVLALIGLCENISLEPKSKKRKAKK